MTTPTPTGRCQRHNNGDAPCLVLAHFPSMSEAQAWARAASLAEGTRFLVRFQAWRSPEHPWEAIQTWLRIM